jgi:hypothetical protein
MIARHLNHWESGNSAHKFDPTVGARVATGIWCCQGARPHVGRGGRAVGSILTFVPKVGFDDATTRIVSAAFEAACRELRDTGQPLVVQEVMAERIVDAARSGERDLIRLRDAALTALSASKQRR